MRIIKDEVKTILAVRNDRFGELLLNIPAFRALKETFKNAKLIVAVSPNTKELAKLIPCIDEIIEWRQDSHSLREKIGFIKFLKSQKIDIAVMLNPSKEFNILTFLSRIPIRVGYDRKWAFLLTHKMKDRKRLGEKHEVEYNLELVGLIQAKTANRNLHFPVDMAVTERIIKQYNISTEDKPIVLHPFTSDSLKQWPYKNFAMLAQKIKTELGVKIIIIGGKEELEKAALFFKRMETEAINLVGKTSLVELAALLRRCRLLISGDSGPVHLACALRTPTIAIFRNDIPGKGPVRWGPWGEGHSVIEDVRLSEITVEAVFQKVREELNSHG